MPNENDISGKVGLDITEFKNGVSQLNREIRVIESGFRAAAAGTENWSNDSDTLGKRIDSLTQIVELQRKKVEKTKEAYDQVAAAQGESSKAAQDLAIKLNNETQALNKSELGLKQATSALDNMGKESKTAGDNADNLSKAMDDMGRRSQLGADIAKKALAAVGVAAAAAGAAVLAFAKSGLDLASDLAEVENVVNVTFGEKGSAAVDKWSKAAATGFGIGELQAKKFNGTMGAMLKSMGLTDDQVLGMSTSISGLAGDFASFYNLDPQEAFDKLRSGISGETEPLKQLGINMSVANLEAFALSQGIDKSFASMTQAEQATLRYNFLMQSTADAQGDYARTSEGFANKQRELTLVTQNLAASFGEKLLPAATEAITKLVDGISGIDPAVFDDLATQLSAMAVSLAEAAVNAIPAVINFVEFMMANGPLIIGIITSIGAGLIAWNVVAMIQGMIGVITAWQAATAGMSIAQRALNLVMAANPVGIVITAIAMLVAGIIYLWNTNEGFRTAIINTWEGIKTSVVNAIAAVKDTISSWTELGTNIIDGIIQGIKNGASKLVKAVKDAVSAAFQAAKDFLGIKSPSTLFRDQVGLMIGAGMAQGITNSVPTVNNAMNKLNKQLTAEAGIKVSAAAGATRTATVATSAEATGKTVMMPVTINVKSAAEATRELNILSKQLAAQF